MAVVRTSACSPPSSTLCFLSRVIVSLSRESNHDVEYDVEALPTRYDGFAKLLRACPNEQPLASTNSCKVTS